jgi:chromosome segregation ATPase
MNWRLRRIRLEAVGPSDARYDDITLAFVADGRAAPNAVLLLRNGGGKSLLLHLLFKALLPRKSDGTKTAAEQREARPVVAADECATVAIEWEHCDEDRLLVTGHSFERGEGTDVRWAFEPRAGSMTLDDLPLRDGRQRRTRAGLMLAMAERGKADSRLRFRQVDGVGAWERELSDVGLDPAILRSQARLNRREGGDDAQLRFRSPEEFVRLVLQMVLDDEALMRLQGQAVTHADQLAQREAKGVEAEFCRDVAVLLRALADAHEQFRAAEEAARVAERRARVVAGVIEAARLQGAGRVEELSRQREPLEQRRGNLETRVRDLRRETNVVNARVAKLRWEAAEEAAARAVETAREADVEYAAWALAGSLISLEEAEGRRRELERQVGAAERGLRDAQASRVEAAERLAAALLHEASLVDGKAGRARGEQTGAETEGRQLADKIGELLRRREEAKERRATRKAELEAFERATRRLREDGLLGRQERPSAAMARVEGELEELAEQRDACARRITTLLQRRDAVTAKLVIDQAATDQAQTELDGLDAQKKVALVRVGEVIGEAVQDTLDVGPTWQPLDEPAGALLAIDAARADSEGCRAAAENQIDSLEADERSLDEDRLLAVELDVQRLCEALDTLGIEAFPALRYLADAYPMAERGALIAAHPEIAAGIVVVGSDPQLAVDELQRADAWLPRRPLVLAGVGDLTGGNGRAPSAVVLPARAAYDQDAAADAAREVAETLAKVREHRDGHRELAAQLGRATVVVEEQAAALRALLPPGSREERRLLEAVERHRDLVERALEIANDRVAGHNAAIGELEEELRAEERDQEQVRAALARTANALERLSVLDDVDVEAGEGEIRRLDELARNLTGEAERLGAARDESLLAAQRHRTKVEELDALAAALRGEAGRLLGDSQPVAAQAGSLAALRAAMAVAEQAVREHIPDASLAGQLKLEETLVTELGRRRGSAEPVVLARAMEIAQSAAGADPELRERGEREAKARYESAHARKGQAETESDERRRLYHEAHDAVSPEGYARAPKILGSLTPPDLAEGAAWLAQLAELRRACDLELVDVQHRLERLDDLVRRENELLAELKDASERLHVAESGEHVGGLPAWTRRAPAIRDEAVAADAGVTSAMRTATAARAVMARELQRVSERIGEADQRIPPGTLAPLRTGEGLAPEAARFEAELRTRAGELDRQIAELEKHREAIVAQLLAIGSDGVRNLERVAKATRLPHEPTLGAWSGKQLARLTYRVVTDEAARRHALARVLDRATTTGRRREGLDLAFDATMALFADGLRVSVLKPHPQPDDQYHPIEKVGPEFSGGEELTIKLVLYCAVSAVRAAERAGRSRGGYRAGPLLIDNPIGTASRESLIDLQLRLARHLEAQFIPFTALEHELNVTGRFSAVVALTNDQDLLSGQRFVRHAGEEIAPRRADDTPEGASVVSAISYVPNLDVEELADEARGR